MGGMGDIGGGCTVDFDFDKTADGDRLHQFHEVDGPARGRGKKRNVKITFPPRWRVPDIVGQELRGGEKVHIEWE